MSPFLTSLLIGFLGLDTTIAFQVLISQPLFSCSILGWLYGDTLLGMEIGMMMQLLWLNIMPVGATLFPEGNLASMVTCAVALRFSELGAPHLIFTSAFLIGIAVSYTGALLTDIDRRVNGRFLDMMLKAAHQADLRRITLLDIASIFTYFLLMSLLAFAALLISEWLVPAVAGAVGTHLEEQLQVVKPTVWGIGIAMTGNMVIRAIKHRY